MERNEEFLQKAEALKRALHTTVVPAEKIVTFSPDGSPLSEKAVEPVRLKKGDAVCLDFGGHIVGRAALKLGYAGSHPDAPAWLRLKFAERPCELFENAESYRGWISTGWIQQEQVHIDVLPTVLELPRRYAFRYLQIEVLDVSGKFSLVLEDAFCKATTSAEEGKLQPYRTADPELKRLDRIACNTLKSCMQDVFEDGPKRDRRLWMGDLRLQALANYETYRNYDLVKRCLYLFAGSTLPGGSVGGCIFTEPEVEVDDTCMFDYSLFYAPTLWNYYEATADRETLSELWPTAKRQFAIVREQFDKHNCVCDSDRLGWCFVDWNLNLNKQASAQGIYLYCLKYAGKIAETLQDQDALRWIRREYDAKKEGALRILWDGKFFVSGADRQISWASQVWMVLGGVLEKDAAVELLDRIAGEPNAEGMVTPYMYHNYIDALISVGQKEKALDVVRSYWGGMVKLGADTFWELYNPQNPGESPYGGTIVNSYCHAWSCAPTYFLRKYYNG